jgi:hypothetical protein
MKILEYTFDFFENFSKFRVLKNLIKYKTFRNFIFSVNIEILKYFENHKF